VEQGKISGNLYPTGGIRGEVIENSKWPPARKGGMEAWRGWPKCTPGESGGFGLRNTKSGNRGIRREFREKSGNIPFERRVVKGPGNQSA